MLFLSETRTISNMNDNELSIPNYALYRIDSQNRHTGGVACYIHSSIKVDIFDCYSQQNIWSMSFKVLYGYSKETFCLIYRGHKSTSSDFINFIDRACEILANKSSTFHLIGDFNYDFLDKPKSATLIRKLKSFNLAQKVNSPTREFKDSSTIIDWVASNQKNLKPIVRNDCNIADHNFIYLDFFSHNCKSNIVCRTHTDWGNYSPQNLSAHLSSLDWNRFDLSHDINEKFFFINDSLSTYLDSCVVTTAVKRNASFKWYNTESSNLKANKLECKARWNTLKSDDNWKLYTRARNLYKNKLKSTEASYIQNELTNNRDDPKKLWRTLKSIYGNDEKSQLNAVKFDSILDTDPASISSKLNGHFVQSVELLVSEIPPIDDNIRFSINTSTTRFSFTDVTYSTVKFYVSDMKKKTYHDNISGKVINDAITNSNFLFSLTSFINQSLSDGIVPNYCKISTVTPIQKVKGSLDVNDLRPINTLCVIGQVLERVVKDQLIEYFELNNLFASQQSGFRKVHSCETSITNVLTDWKDAVDKNLVVVAVFIDLKRAFETVDRQLLLHKLSLYGCDETVINWFTSYLSDRCQQTRFGTAISGLLSILIGVSQGSVLSCILFIIFINDIVNVVRHTKIKLFADDMLIYITCKPSELEATVAMLNDDLKRIYEWLCYSKLALNVSKSKAMLISSNKSHILSHPIYLNEQEIEVVSEFKYLGIIIDSNMSFAQHFESVLKKLNSKFYVLKRSEHKLNFESKKLYVSSLVMPHFNYCASVLFLLCDSQIGDFQKVMNRYARLLLKAEYLTPRVEMLQKLNWLSVKQTIYLNTILYIHRIAIGLSPIYLQQHMTKTKECHQYPTRRNDEYQLKNYTKASSQNSLFYKGLKLYNEFTRYRKSKSNGTTLSTRLVAIEFVTLNYPLD